MLQSKLSLAEAHLGIADNRLRHARGRVHERFEKCKALAIQILPSAEASLLQIFIPAIPHALAIFRLAKGEGIEMTFALLLGYYYCSPYFLCFVFVRFTK